MFILSESRMSIVNDMFKIYDTNIPVFQSVLDGNYKGTIFVDNENSPTWAALTTADCYTFVAGNLPAEKILDDTLFNRVLENQEEKQLIVFSPSTDWHRLLESVFLPRGGFIVPRKIFSFSLEEYKKAGGWRDKIPSNAEVVITKECFEPACINKEWVARLMFDDVCASTAVSVSGGGYAELGIETSPDFQGKGYATVTALALIEKLLQESVIPCWSTWPEREASQKVAQKIGFLPMLDIEAWVWEG